VAYYVNGITGFGSNLVFIPLAALVIGPKEAVILCSALNPFAGATLIKVDTKNVPRRYWLPLSISMIAGTVVGAITLKMIPNEIFGATLGILILLLGIWFLCGRRGGSFKGLTESLPDSSSVVDRSVCVIAGFCGGSFGINGPPLIWHFGRMFAKEAFRKVLILIFFPASLFQIGTYLVLGLVSKKLCLLLLVSLPLLFLGTFLGNHTFYKISLRWFNIAIGVTLVVTALKLLFSSITISFS